MSSIITFYQMFWYLGDFDWTPANVIPLVWIYAAVEYQVGWKLFLLGLFGIGYYLNSTVDEDEEEFERFNRALNE